MSLVRLEDLYYGLGQTPPPSAPTTGYWSQQAQLVSAPAATPDWNQVGNLATALIAPATAAGAIPVATAAQAVQAATQAITAGAGSAAVAQTAVASLVEAAQFEDNATDIDRDTGEQIISGQINQLGNDVDAWNTKNSGWLALWDKISGNVNRTALDAEIAQIQDTINTTPLTILGRQQLQQQLNLTVTGIGSDIDWSSIGLAIGTVAALAAIQWGISKAQALAAAHAQKHWERITGKGKKGKETKEEDKEGEE